MRDGGQIPLWMKRVDQGSNNMISCRTTRYGVCRTTRYRLVQRDIMSNKSISCCSTQCSGPVIQDATRHHASVSWTLTITTPDHRHTHHHRLSTPFFLIDQCQRDGCDDLPIAQRSTGKKGGGGWGGGRREVRIGDKAPPSRTKIVV